MIEFAGLCFRGLTKKSLLEIESHLKLIVTANAEIIVKAHHDSQFKEILDKSILTLDGQIPFWLAKRKHKNIKIDKISGSDLIYDTCAFAFEKSLKVFLLGGLESSNKLAVEKLRELYQIQINGYSPPFQPYPFAREFNDEILNKIALFRPHILFVGFGAGKQEFWINENRVILEKLGVKIAVGCGGTFEFVSGKIKRAPFFIQKIGLESIWRLIMEPKWFRVKRLLVSILIFKYLVRKSK